MMRSFSPRLLSFLSVSAFLLAFFCTTKSVDAAGIEVYPNITSDGVVYEGDTTLCFSTPVLGIQMYKGIYPDTSDVITPNSGTTGNQNSVCSVFFDEGFGSSLEDGWGGGTYPSGTDDGIYWARYTFAGSVGSPDYSGAWYWFKAIRSGGVWSDFGDQTGVITVNYPLNGAIFTTTPLNNVEVADVGYSISIFNGVDPIEQAKITFTNQDFSGVEYSTTTSISTLGINDIIGTTTNMIGGGYSISVLLRSVTGGYAYYEPNISNFIVGSSTYLEDLLGISNPNDPTNLFGLATTTCSLGNIAGCFQNAIMLAFYPSEQAVSKITSIGDLIKNKPPIGYFFKLKDAIDDISASSTPKFSITIPQGIIDLFFHPLNIAVASVLGWFFAVHLWNRIKNIIV